MDGIITYLSAGWINNNFSAISGAETHQPMTKRLKIICLVWLFQLILAICSILIFSPVIQIACCESSTQLNRLAAISENSPLVDFDVAVCSNLSRESFEIINHHYLSFVPGKPETSFLSESPAQLTNFPEHQRKQKSYFQIKL